LQQIHLYMTIEKVNNAFNEALEEINIEDNETFSVEFIQHHEASLQDKIKRLRKINSAQFFIFLVLFLFIIFNTDGRFVQIPYEVNRYMFIILWGVILVNNYFSVKRSKKITQMEQQLLLIGVYKKIVAD
jgi:hypothetical protein